MHNPPMLERAERILKAGLRQLSAVNQGPAKVVLDPMYETVAAAMLRGVKRSARLVATRYDDNLYFRYQQASRKLQWSIEDWDFSQARPELLPERQKAILHSFATGETSGFAVGAGFLHAFRSSQELGPFFGIWFVEELNHYWGYHRYLERMGQAWADARKKDVTQVAFRPYSDDPLEVAAANMYQELVGYLVYRSFARSCRDPFLARLVDRFAKDELRHYKFYQSVCARQIQRDPSFRVLVLKHFLKATTPINQVAGGARQTLGHLTSASHYFRKPEFEFLLTQLEFLLGDPLEGWFERFYRRHTAPCERCCAEVFRCACEEVDRAAA
jgi:hypothetical protein